MQCSLCKPCCNQQSCTMCRQCLGHWGPPRCLASRLKSLPQRLACTLLASSQQLCAEKASAALPRLLVCMHCCCCCFTLLARLLTCSSQQTTPAARHQLVLPTVTVCCLHQQPRCCCCVPCRVLQSLQLRPAAVGTLPYVQTAAAPRGRRAASAAASPKLLSLLLPSGDASSQRRWPAQPPCNSSIPHGTASQLRPACVPACMEMSLSTLSVT